MELKIDPNEIKVCPFCGVLDKRRWEDAAAYLVAKAQKKGEWTPIKEWHSDFDIENMLAAGYLDKVDGGYLLSPLAMLKLYQKYPAIEDGMVKESGN
jgi:hypothetical protein